MTTKAPITPLAAITEERNSFIQAAEAFMIEAVEGYATIEQQSVAAAEAHRKEISGIRAESAGEIQRLNLVATTATAAAEEQVRHRTALAVAAVEESFAPRLAEASAVAVADANACREAELRSLRDDHEQQLHALRDDHAAMVADLHRGFSSTVESAKEAVIQTLVGEHRLALSAVQDAAERELAAASQAHEQAAVDAAAAHERALADLRSQGDLKAAGIQTMWMAADGARAAAVAELAEARVTIEQLAAPAAESSVAPEIDDILYPQGAPVENPAADLVPVEAQLAAANSEIASLREARLLSGSALEGLREKLGAAVSVRDRLEGEVTRLTEASRMIPERACTHGEPDPTVASMKVARIETQAVVRLVAEANPHVMLVEAADLLGAALLGRTETAVPLPLPVLVGVA